MSEGEAARKRRKHISAGGAREGRRRQVRSREDKIGQGRGGEEGRILVWGFHTCMEHADSACTSTGIIKLAGLKMLDLQELWIAENSSCSSQQRLIEVEAAMPCPLREGPDIKLALRGEVHRRRKKRRSRSRSRRSRSRRRNGREGKGNLLFASCRRVLASSMAWCIVTGAKELLSYHTFAYCWLLGSNSAAVRYLYNCWREESRYKERKKEESSRSSSGGDDDENDENDENDDDKDEGVTGIVEEEQVTPRQAPPCIALPESVLSLTLSTWHRLLTASLNDLKTARFSKVRLDLQMKPSANSWHIGLHYLDRLLAVTDGLIVHVHMCVSWKRHPITPTRPPILTRMQSIVFSPAALLE
eukprot:763842-Hanusia_phi.AAC.8